MAAAAIHVVPDDSFEDWVVRDDNGEMGKSSATTLPEKPPSWSPRRSRESVAMSSSFTCPTEE
jgi:hypothetical protein